jgi:hypothetical protein
VGGRHSPAVVEQATARARAALSHVDAVDLQNGFQQAVLPSSGSLAVLRLVGYNVTGGHHRLVVCGGQKPFNSALG